MKASILTILLVVTNILFSQKKDIEFPDIITSNLYIIIENINGKEFYKKRNEVILDNKYDILIQIKDKTPNNASLFGGKSTGYIEKGVFNVGYKTGHWQTLYKHTLVKSEHWNNGLITGKYTVYNTDKKILYQTNFESLGNGKYKDYYYKTGILKEEGNYENGKKEGKWCFYNSNGTLKDSIIYVKGVAKTKT